MYSMSPWKLGVHLSLVCRIVSLIKHRAAASVQEKTTVFVNTNTGYLHLRLRRRAANSSKQRQTAAELQTGPHVAHNSWGLGAVTAHLNTVIRFIFNFLLKATTTTTEKRSNTRFIKPEINELLCQYCRLIQKPVCQKTLNCL